MKGPPLSQRCIVVAVTVDAPRRTLENFVEMNQQLESIMLVAMVFPVLRLLVQVRQQVY